MRKTLLLLAFFGTFIGLQAQRDFQAQGERERVVELRSTPRSSVVPDTLIPSIFFEDCADTLFNYQVPDDGGFLAGTNNFLDREKTQRISFPQTVTFQVLSVLAFFATVDEEVEAQSVSARLYSVNEETGGPDELLATSDSLTFGQVNLSETEFVETVFNFPDPPTITGDGFFVSIDFSDVYNVDVGNASIFTTRDGCGDGSTSWELWQDNTWHPMNDDMGWDAELELFMGAVVETDVAASVREPLEDLRLTVAPNPVSDVTVINFTLPQATELDVTVFDATGKAVLHRAEGRFGAGNGQITLDLHTLTSGMYTYRLRTAEGIGSGRLIVK